MGILQKIIASMYEDCKVEYTNAGKVFTKYGMYEAKIYKQNGQEFLCFMSVNLASTKEPILYVHFDGHECSPFDEHCGCSSELDLAMKSVAKEGGVILYISKGAQEMDNFLSEIRMKKLAPKTQVEVGSNLRSLLQGYRGEYLAIDFILKDLKLSKVKLIADSIDIVYIVQRLGLEVVKQSSSISYNYGDTKPENTQKTIDAAKALSFSYN